VDSCQLAMVCNQEVHLLSSQILHLCHDYAILAPRQIAS